MISLLRRLLPLVSDRSAVRRSGWLILLSCVVHTAAVLVLIPLFGRLFGPRPSEALSWVAALAVAVVIGWLVDRRLSQSAATVAFDLLPAVDQRALAHLQRVPLDWIRADRRADIVKVLSEAGAQLCSGVVYLMVPAISAVVTPALIAIGLLFFSWPVGLTALAAYAVLLLAQWVGSRLSTAADAAFERATTDAGDRVVEFARAQPALRAAGRAGAPDSAVMQAVDRQSSAARRLVFLAAPGQLAFAIAVPLMLGAIVTVAVIAASNGSLTIAQTIAMVIVAIRLVEPMTGMANLSGAIESLQNLVRQIAEIMDAPALPEPASEPPVPGTAGGCDVVLRDVTYSHPTAPGAGPVTEPVLSHIDIDIPAGTTTAIVGPSGAGKSTLLSLIARFRDVDSGAVLIGGRDVRERRLDELMREIAIVFQDVYLFDADIRENILMGRRDATEQQLADAVRAAALDDVLDRLPHGWHTRVGEAGEALSGGERQRVSIARALLKDSPLLLLDEATSALDTRSEAAVVAALDARAGKATTVIVAHRLSTIARADQVVFLESGRVVERGTPDELRAAAGRFADYWRHREQAAGWTLTAAAD